MYVSVIEMEISGWEYEKKYSLRKQPVQKIMNRVETISDRYQYESSIVYYLQ